ncbi:MAG: septal ring lytic transglycosylase RlpA family protein [Treponema sp.]|jgi:rare lipoprotein A|nr:septal ring lytic transglycosylase RlpA family protein [Treponema sp.]
MKRIIVCVLIGLGFTLFCTAQNQPTLENGIYRQEGIASWYGTEFDGRYTASGEIFDSTKFTASHPTLPFGTILTVTNTQNNKQVIVRINDRGPLKPVRIIDVSKAAAEQLDMIAVGTAQVIIESRGTVSVSTVPSPGASPSPQPADAATPMVDPVRTPAPAPAPGTPRVAPAAIKPGIPPLGTDKRYRIQVGAYKVLQNARDVFDKLKNTGLNPAYERNGDIYRVVLAGIKADDVQLIAEKLGSAGFREALIREE